uniref:Uncharacterized protein n=1 Tax=Tanacetum cinerariifolium TaxID=118510 RepID=A0A699RZC3_TANCI|nr:hypothetical protein [Tanacetum cinerariifolium]
MNYHLVLAENQTNSHEGFQDTEKSGKEETQTYVLFPVLSNGSTNPKNNKDAHTDRKEHDDNIQKDLNEEFAECINNSSNGDNVAGSLVFAAGLNFTNSTNDFSAAGKKSYCLVITDDYSRFS